MGNLPQGTVTLLFTDIEGSTRLLHRLGDRYGEVLAESRQLLQVAFQRWNGVVVDTQGDAFFVAFARANDAVSAAVDAQRTLFSTVFLEDVTVHVRIGMHTGEPEVAGEGYIGMDVHKAARVMSAAHGGQVVLSQTTCDLIEHDLPVGVSLRNLGAYRLKDIEGPNSLYQLVIAGLPADFPALNTPGNHTILHSFPGQPTPFIGRQQELTAASALLRQSDVRLLTLSGTGGIGKSRLALQVATACADLFTDGVYFVALAQVSMMDDVLPTIAQTLGIREERGQSLFDRLLDMLSEKRLLLILDNMEHVIASAALLAEFLACCPHMKMLVTSREALHVRAEHIFEVPLFSVPDLAHLPDLDTLAHNPAVTLFMQRAQAVKPNFSLTSANAPDVVGICLRLDGLPLAIELAAARIKYGPPQSILAQLEQGLETLKGGARDLSARQQTLRNAIAWSYELLDDQQQQLFRRLAIFVNGCTLRAAQQVCHTVGKLHGDMLDKMEALVDKSLLRQEEQATDEPRFLMLQTLREYGKECLASTGELAATRKAHALYYLTLAEEILPKLAGVMEAEWLDYLETEHENLHTALAWFLEQAPQEAERVEQAVRFCTALIKFWEIRGYFQEAYTLLTRTLAVSKSAVDTVKVQVLYPLAVFQLMIQGDTEKGRALLEECLALFRRIDDKAGTAKVLRLLGQLQIGEKTVEARSLLEASLALYEELDDSYGIGLVRNDLARAATRQGDYARARSLLEKNLALYRTREDAHSRAHPLLLLAVVLFLTKGNQEIARYLAEESLEIFRGIGDRRLAAFVLQLLSELSLFQGDVEKAQAYCEESIAFFRDLDDRNGVAQSLLSLARVLAYRGDELAAYNTCKESWMLLREVGDSEQRATCLEQVGELLENAGKPDQLETAAELWGKAATLRATLVAPMPPIYRPAYGKAVASVREQLGTERFQAAWTEGRNMPVGQIII
ncbi:MAG TPA: tetratricopeptide repeat protein [Ktedonobacteraceae bacterium]|nr:tetratricopeptide repeat protein [Ktedonobacteraceae bacterium]